MCTCSFSIFVTILKIDIHKKGKQNFLESAYHSLEFAYLQLQLPYCLVNTSFVMKSYTYGTRRAKQWHLNNDIKMPFGRAFFFLDLQKLISKALESNSFRETKFIFFVLFKTQVSSRHCTSYST